MLSPSQLHDVVHVYLAEAKEDLATAKQHDNRFTVENQSLETLSLLALARKAVAQGGRWGKALQAGRCKPASPFRRAWSTAQRGA